MPRVDIRAAPGHFALLQPSDLDTQTENSLRYITRLLIVHRIDSGCYRSLAVQLRLAGHVVI